MSRFTSTVPNHLVWRYSTSQGCIGRGFLSEAGKEIYYMFVFDPPTSYPIIIVWRQKVNEYTGFWGKWSRKARKTAIFFIFKKPVRPSIPPFVGPSVHPSNYPSATFVAVKDIYPDTWLIIVRTSYVVCTRQFQTVWWQTWVLTKLSYDPSSPNAILTFNVNK